MIAFFIVFPDDPSSGYMTLFQGFMAALEQMKWNQKNGGIYRCYIFVNCIQYLCSSVQENLPYHFQEVKSNDQLFNKDPQYGQKILELVQALYVRLGEQAQTLQKLTINDHNVKALLNLGQRTDHQISLAYR